MYHDFRSWNNNRRISFFPRGDDCGGGGENSASSPNKTKSSIWTLGSKFWIYFGVLLVYLTLIFIVVILIILMLPKYKLETSGFPSSVIIPKTNPPLILKPPRTGIYAIDPRSDLPLSINVIDNKTEVRKRDRADYNSKLLNLDKIFKK